MEYFLIPLFFLVIATYVILIIVVFLLSTDVDYKRKTVYLAIINIYDKKISIEKSIEQLYISFNYINNRNNNLKLEKYLENYIALYDTMSEEKFERVLKNAKNNDIREFIIELLNYLHNKNPFYQLNETEASILTNIKNFAKEKNSDHIKHQIKELAKELRKKDEIISKANKANRISFIVSIIGVVLTIFFGILSLF